MHNQIQDGIGFILQRNGFTVNPGRFNTNLNYQVIDFAGRIIKSGVIGKQQQFISLPALAPGSYILKISNGIILKIEKN